MTTPPPVPPSAAPLNPADEKLWATLVHLGGLFLGFLAPLIGYLVLRDRGPFVRAQTATALNFQLTLIIAYLVGGILTFLLIGVFIILAGLSGAISWLAYFAALRLGVASKISALDRLSVAFIFVLSMIFLGERHTWQGWLGLGLLVSGVYLIASD